MKRLVLLDSHSLIHRAYHALPKTFKTTDGKNTNAVYGFTRMMLKVMKDLKPDYLAAVFDSPGPTFRTEMAPTYKAHRPAADRELVEQFSYVDEVVAAMGVQSVRMGGYEADDLIATLATKFGSDLNRSNLNRLDLDIVIVTGDNDLMQLVSPTVKVYYPVKGLSEAMMYGEGEVREKFDLEPDQISDYKALRGDPSDNIPGVPGIGEKSAKELLQKYGTLDNIFTHLEEISGRSHDLLLEHRQQAETSKALASLETGVPLQVGLADLSLHLDPAKYRPVLEKYQFTSLIKQMEEGSALEVSRIALDQNQMTLL